MTPRGAAGLRLALLQEGGVTRAVRVVDERPLPLSALTRGLSPDAACERVRAVFALCPHAQAQALGAALAAARDVEPPETTSPLIERAEALVRRVALHGEPPVLAPDAGLARQGVIAARAGDWEGLALACEAAARRAHAIATTVHGLPCGAAVGPAPFDPTDLSAIAARLWDDPTFARRPTWNGAPREIGPRAKHGGWQAPSPALRWACAAAELVELATGMADANFRARATRPPVARLDAGVGVARVETSRGALIVTARLTHDGRVADARSVAPTEWNLHPDGALAMALVGAPADEAMARRVIMSLDPCVDVRVSVLPDAADDGAGGDGHA